MRGGQEMQPVHVLTNRHDNARSGVNLAETKLDVANVNVSQFGKLFTRSVDGDLYAQPLVVSGMTIEGATCNVVFLATSRNTVYAYEADDPEACLPLWTRNLGPPVPRDDVLKKLGRTYHYLNFASEIGITSTPAIELASGGGTLYVVAKTRRITSLGGALSKTYSHTIHALDLATGTDKPIPNNPMEIRATALRSDGSIITFDPLFQLNRPGLLLADGVLYVAFGSHGDFGEFYGWIMAYDAATLVQRAVYCTAPDWTEGGVWQSGCGLAADDKGFVYAVVGNGEKPSNHPDRIPDVTSATGIQAPVFGNSILKLNLTRMPGGDESLEVADWYTAPDVMDLNQNDNDIMGGPVLFEAPGADGSTKRLVLGGGKDGRFYLLDRDRMGKWAPLTGGKPAHWDAAAKQWVAWQGGTRPKNAVQDDKVCNYHIHGAPIVWKNPSGGVINAYVWSEQDALKALQLQAGRFVYEKTSKTSTSAYRFPEDEMRMPGGFLALSADGESDGTAIVWASHPTDDDAMNKSVTGTLRAFDARDLNAELWNSDQDADGSDRVGLFAKFNTPVVANGKVYLATFSRELAVYGLYADIETTRLIRAAGIFDIGGFGANIDGDCIATCSRYDITASGAGLKGTSDSFFFAYRVIDLDEQPRVSIAARLVGLNNLPAVPDNPDGIAGVMIRKFTGAVPSARYAAVVVTADNRVMLQSRKKDGAAGTKPSRRGKAEPRSWLRLSCEPASISGSFSFQAEIAHERDVWKPVGGPVVIPIDGRVMVGLAATAQVTPSPSPTDPTPQAHAKVQARFGDVLVTPVT
jgi:hypothetical protein